MTERSQLKPPVHFAVSLHPEIFYALQAFTTPDARIHPRWKSMALERFPASLWPLSMPGILWSAVPDALDIEPTTEFAVVLRNLAELSPRILQERILTGLLHQPEASSAILDEGLPLHKVIAGLPRIKREWLGHVGLYPVEADVAESLERLVRSPEAFGADLVAMLRQFWDRVFAKTWGQLLPGFERSVHHMEQIRTSCTFQELLRKTLIPLELHEGRQLLRALRGGSELRLKDIAYCTFTPSAFNDSRFWTTYDIGKRLAPWFPYFDPDLKPRADADEGDLTLAAPDIALIFRALGDTTRFAMASLLGRRPRAASELANALSVSKPTISHHLHVLRSAGLLHEFDHGGSVLISLNADVLRRLSDLTCRALLESREPVFIQRSRKVS